MFRALKSIRILLLFIGATSLSCSILAGAPSKESGFAVESKEIKKDDLVDRFFEEPQDVKANAIETNEVAENGVKVNGDKAVVSPAADANLDFLMQVNQRYSQAKSISLVIEKRVIQAILGRETLYQGKLWAVRNRLRIEFTTPSPAFMVVDGKYVWMVNSTPKELGGGMQVAKTKMDFSKKSQGWMSLLGRKKITDSFKVKSSLKKEKKISYKLEPTASFQDLSEAEMVLNTETQEIERLTYWDDLENETVMTFSKVTFGGKLDKKLFVYRPPKGVEVVTY
jgi:outer membrane lipoprotein carrier protein